MNMRKVAITELRTRLTAVLALVEAGETIRVTRRGRPIADIRPVAACPPSWKRRSARSLPGGGTLVSDLILTDRGL
jgi:prevent-host-death family protein